MATTQPNAANAVTATVGSGEPANCGATQGDPKPADAWNHPT
jgi:hypothetical protein